MPQHIRNASVSNMSLLCNKSITRASHRQGVSVDFLRKNANKSKFPVPKTFQKRNRLIQDTVNLLRPCCASPFSGLFRHTLRVAFYFSTLFLQCISCIFLYIYSIICVFQSITDFCVRFFRSTPLPSRSPFLGCSRPLAVLSATKNSTGSLFRAICAVPYFLFKNYIKRRAAPKSRPPTIQAML